MAIEFNLSPGDGERPGDIEDGLDGFRDILFVGRGVADKGRNPPLGCENDGLESRSEGDPGTRVAPSLHAGLLRPEWRYST